MGDQSTILHALGSVESPPCDYGCEHRAACAERELSCRAFVRYVFRGCRTYRDPDDMPTARLFRVDRVENFKIANERMHAMFEAPEPESIT